MSRPGNLAAPLTVPAGTHVEMLEMQDVPRGDLVRISVQLYVPRASVRRELFHRRADNEDIGR